MKIEIKNSGKTERRRKKTGFIRKGQLGLSRSKTLLTFGEYKHGCPLERMKESAGEEKYQRRL